MSQDPTEQDIQSALENCAAEPVHIPGLVQPFACLLAVDPETSEVRYASDNIDMILPATAQDLLGTSLRDHVDRLVWHALNNARAQPGFDTKARTLGKFPFNEKDYTITAFQSGPVIVLQFEPHHEMSLGGGDGLATLNFLVEHSL